MLAMQAFSIGQQAQSGAAQQPPQAAQPPFIPPRATIITGPDGTRTITATYQVGSSYQFINVAAALFILVCNYMLNVARK